MGKPRPRHIPSDGCGVRIDGEVYYPHEGEWVELVASETIGELRARVAFARLGPELDAVKGEPDEGRQMNAIMEAHYASLTEHLAERIFEWSWTDLHGRPLPSPADGDGKPLGLLKLRADELYWLLTATAPEAADERKNA